MMEQTAYATAPPVLYELSGVGKSCEGPAERITILKNIDLTVRAGESLAIVGASGSGKSTLLHLLGALDTPTAGKVLFEGKSLPDMTPEEKAHFRNRKLGFVFQFHHLLPEFSAEENVAMQALIAGMNRSKALGLARQALGRVGLSDRKDHRVTTLSGGERQRAAIARAILLEPRVLLADEPTLQRLKLADRLKKRSQVYIFDEPTRGLHFKDTEKLVGVMNKLVDTGNTVIVVEHNLDVIAQADWIIDMGPEGGKEGGKIIFEGPTAKIIKPKESYRGQVVLQQSGEMRNLESL